MEDDRVPYSPTHGLPPSQLGFGIVTIQHNRATTESLLEEEDLGRPKSRVETKTSILAEFEVSGT